MRDQTKEDNVINDYSILCISVRLQQQKHREGRFCMCVTLIIVSFIFAFAVVTHSFLCCNNCEELCRHNRV